MKSYFLTPDYHYTFFKAFSLCQSATARKMFSKALNRKEITKYITAILEIFNSDHMTSG